MSIPTHRRGQEADDRAPGATEPNAAVPAGKDAIAGVEERQQRDAGERSRQALDNQGAQGRTPHPARHPPAERPLRK